MSPRDERLSLGRGTPYTVLEIEAKSNCGFLDSRWSLGMTVVGCQRVALMGSTAGGAGYGYFSGRGLPAVRSFATLRISPAGLDARKTAQVRILPPGASLV